MTYKFTYITFVGMMPKHRPMLKTTIVHYDSLNDIHEWIKKNMMPSSIWWVSYEIECANTTIDYKRNSNLDEGFRSR